MGKKASRSKRHSATEAGNKENKTHGQTSASGHGSTLGSPVTSGPPQQQGYYNPLYNYEQESAADYPWNNLASVEGGAAVTTGAPGQAGSGYPPSNATAGSGAEGNGQGGH